MTELNAKKMIKKLDKIDQTVNKVKNAASTLLEFEKKMNFLTLPLANGGVLSGNESYIKGMLMNGGSYTKSIGLPPMQTTVAGAIPSMQSTIAGATPSFNPALSQIDVHSLSLPPDIKAFALGMMPKGLYFTFKVGGIPDLLFTVVKYDLHEQLSEMYELELQVTSFESDIDLEPMLMRSGTLEVVRNGITERKLTGIIECVTQESTSLHKSFYRFTVRPHLWCLTLAQDSRIFHNLSVPQIIQQILEEHQILVQMRLTETHEPREYTTQKRENCYEFIARLAAEEGMTFWFLNEEVIFADNCIALESRIGMVFNPEPDNTSDGNILSKLFAKANMRPHKVSNKDYYWRRPSSPMKSEQEAESQDASALAYEVYDSYARFQDKKTADRMTRFRLESLRAESLSVEAVGHSAAIMPGGVLQISAHPSHSRNGDWQVVRVTHHGVMPEASENQIHASGTEITNTMTLVSANIPWRPAFKHKPVAEGDELAVVVGPEGEEIYTNEFGAVKIHFHWNRYDAKDENASHWVRVANAWNGKDKSGFVAIPRIGQEVIVTYLDGDIDRPIIIGTTYTGSDILPLDLPSQKTRTAWRSKTHKGNGFNEISFDDDNGNQEVFIHAQKNMNTTVLNNRTTQVHQNHSETIGVSKFEEIGELYQLTVGGDRETTVKQNQLEQIMLNKTIKIGQNLSVEVGEVIELRCGASTLRMDKQGKVTITGTEFNFEASGPVQITGKDIDLN